MRSFIIQNRETKGPYTIGQLRSMWSSGAITGDTLYREEGSDDWNTLAAISADLEQTQQSDHPIHTPPPPMRSQSAPTPGRQQGKPRSVAKVFGLGCLSVIGLIVLLGIVGAILNGVSPQDPEHLMLQAESSLRSGEFSRSAELLNRIVSEHPASRQAGVVRELGSFIRGKEAGKRGPLTTSEAQTVRKLMDSFDQIKKGYWTATPEKRRDLELVFGAETFRRTDNGLDALSSCGAKFRDALDKARQGQ